MGHLGVSSSAWVQVFVGHLGVSTSTHYYVFDCDLVGGPPLSTCLARWDRSFEYRYLICESKVLGKCIVDHVLG